MKKLVVLFVAVLVAAGVPGAGAGPSAGGLSSDNVVWVDYIPFDVGTASGAKIIGKYMYVTSWRNFSIYDISDPLAPELLVTEPFGFEFENEDVDGNNKLLIFSEELPRSALHVWDVENKTDPEELAVLQGAGQHTTSCLADCTWLYGSDGNIIDLRNPAEPKKLDYGWGEGLPTSNAHDVDEIAPGRVLTSSDPMMLLDTTDPAHPKLLATAEQMGEFIHSTTWPRHGRDDFVLSTGETWIPGADARCDQTSGGFTTWDASNWKTTHAMTKIETYRPRSGTYVDGHPPSGNTFGCSTHWFEHSPSFKNGGIAAVTFFNHGTHFLRVSDEGKISDEGWFIPHAGNSAAAYWLSDRIVYSVDLQRGFDILRYKGKLYR